MNTFASDIANYKNWIRFVANPFIVICPDDTVIVIEGYTRLMLLLAEIINLRPVWHEGFTAAQQTQWQIDSDIWKFYNPVIKYNHPDEEGTVCTVTPSVLWTGIILH